MDTGWNLCILNDTSSEREPAFMIAEWIAAFWKRVLETVNLSFEKHCVPSTEHRTELKNGNIDHRVDSDLNELDSQWEDIWTMF